MARSKADHVVTANRVLLEEGRAEAAADFFSPDYVVHLTVDDRRGLPLVERFVRGLRRSFPDLRVEVEVLLTEGDRVAWQRTCRATHRGDFQGFPATGQELVWRDQLVSRFEGDRIAEEWAVSDLAERLLRARPRRS